MYRNPRETTNRILSDVENGTLDAYTVLRDALNYMSGSEVEDFASQYDLYPDDEEEEDEDEYDDEDDI